MSSLEKTENDIETRRSLKIKILQTKADEIQKKMDTAMDEIEIMVQEYTDIMKELQETQEISVNQNKKHIELMTRMMGEKEKKKVNYGACNTSEEMLQLVMDELDQVKKMETKIKEQEVSIPDVGDNTEIWNRIAKAQQVLKEEENNKSDLITSTLEVVNEETTPELQTQVNNEESHISSTQTSTHESSISSTDEDIDDMNKSVFT